MGTSPAKKTGDASDRKPVGKVRLGGAAAGGDASQRNPTGRMSLGVAVLGGDASQRSPPGCTNLVGATPKNQLLCHMKADASERSSVVSRVPTGTAQHSQQTCGQAGDASQRSPQTCGQAGDASQRSPQTVGLAATLQRNGYILPVPTTSTQSIPTGIASTQPSTSSPVSSSCSSPSQDASQRTPTKGADFNPTADTAHVALKSWLLGAGATDVQMNDSDLAERLRAAAPQSYED